MVTQVPPLWSKLAYGLITSFDVAMSFYPLVESEELLLSCITAEEDVVAGSIFSVWLGCAMT